MDSESLFVSGMALDFTASASYACVKRSVAMVEVPPASQ